MQHIGNDIITLRPFSEKDVNEYVEAVLESEETVGYWMPWWQDFTGVDDALQWFNDCAENLKERTAYDIGIFLREDEHLIGSISINNIDWDNKIGNVGYWVRETDQDRGFATMAVDLIQNYGFTTLGLVRLEIVVLEANFASRRIAEKCGFSFEVVAKNRLMHQDQSMPGVIYSKVC